MLYFLLNQLFYTVYQMNMALFETCIYEDGCLRAISHHLAVHKAAQGATQNKMKSAITRRWNLTYAISMTLLCRPQALRTL